MDVSLISAICCALVSSAAVLASLYCSYSARHLRDWQDRCDAFVRGHQQVDRELDRVWESLDR